MTNDKQDPPHWKLVEKKGPRFFTTEKIYEDETDGIRRTWESRIGRKHLRPNRQPKPPTAAEVLRHALWMPQDLNWWIGLIFAIGAGFFVFGGVLALAPALKHAWGMTTRDINLSFFIGSVPFTLAAYLQLFQAANACEDGSGNEIRPERTRWIGWAPQDIGWLAGFTQFIGTVLFNFNTFDAMLPGMSWVEDDGAVWLPDLVGCVLFLFSGYLLYAEEVNGNFGWRPRDLSWWVVSVNFLGCIFFMASAIFAVSLPVSLGIHAGTISTATTVAGAVCFFFGALLLLPEAVDRDELALRLA